MADYVKKIHAVKLDTLAMLASDTLKVDNAINTCLITLKIIQYLAIIFH